MLTRDGLHGASMAAIAREAGMSKRTLYGVFASRAALFEACVGRLRASFVRPLGERERALPLPERLKRLLMPDAGGAALETPSEILRAVVAEAPRQPELARAFLRAGPRAAQELVREEIERAAALGEIAPCDAAALAALLCDMAYESPVLRLVDPDAGGRAPSEIEARLDAAIRVFLHGVAAAPAGPRTGGQARKG